jgi:hypothetical protein
MLVPPLGITAHLDHVKPPVFVERKRDGIFDERFGGDQFDSETRANAESFQRLGGFERLDARKVIRSDARFGGETEERAGETSASEPCEQSMLHGALL